MSSLDYLIPINNKNSIKEVVISIFFENEIDNFKYFKDKFDKNSFHNYSTFDFTFLKSASFQIHPDTENPDIKYNKQDNGFQVKKIESERLLKLIQLQIEPERKYLSFHSLKYDRWNVFFNEFKSIITVFDDFDEKILLTAISLNYIDEFKYNSDENIPINKVLNKHNRNLPPKIFTNDNSLFVILSDNKKDDLELTERLELNISNKEKKIKISHNSILKFSESHEIEEFILSNSINDYFLELHELNKKTYKDLLSQDAAKLIEGLE